MSRKEQNRTNHRQGRGWRILLVVLVLIVGIRLALPYILLDQLNKRLKAMPEYYGHVDDLSLGILRGAYAIHDVYLDKQDSLSGDRTPFVAADDVDLSVHWGALLKGKFAGEIIIQRPIIRFTKEQVEPSEVVEDTVLLADLLDDLMPIDINRFEIHNGSFQFRDPTTSPQVFLAMENIDLHAENLTTEPNEDVLLPASVNMFANVYDGGFDLDMELDPLAESPTFDMAVEVSDANLTEFNEFFQAYGNFDVEKGTFGMFAEIAAKDGKFLGYIKPVIKDLKVLGPDDKDKNIGEKVWQGIVALGASLLTNPREEQIATRVPLEGDLEDPNVMTWYAVIDLLRNAFISALEPQLDHDISIDRVPVGFEEDDRGFFKQLFGGDQKEGETRTQRRERRQQKREDRR